MAIRQTSGDFHGVTSGFNTDNIPDDIRIPSCGLEDVDIALFNMFDKEIGFEVVNTINGSKNTTAVAVIFASGEKWAQLKLNKPIRDDNGVFILPLISIRRTNITQESSDITDRGINQHTGDIVIKRRLSKKDRAYQNIINKFAIRNQDNLPDPTGKAGIVATKNSSNVGELSADPDVINGAFLAPKLGDNIFEFLTIPQPQFFTAHYEITFWTKYSVHMNQIIEKLMGAFLPQGLCLKLETPKGYWFIAYAEGTFTAGDNFDDSTGEERIIKHSFELRVPAYRVAPDGPGDSAPVRRFISAPRLEFEMSIGAEVGDSDATLYPGSSDPSADLLLSGQPNPRPVEGVNQVFTTQIVKNPFTGQNDLQYMRVLTGKSKFGESVSVPDDRLIKIDLGDD